MALAVARQIHRLGVGVLAHAAGARPALVDVVADVHDEPRIVLGDPLVGGEVARLPVRAAGQAEPQALRRLAAPRSGARPPDRARLAVGVEAVEVLPPGPEVRYLDVHRVTLRRDRGLGAARDDPRDRLVVGQFPRDRHLALHRLTPERVERDPRPEHDAVRRRLARGDAGHERIRPARQRRGTRAEQPAGRRARPLRRHRRRAVRAGRCEWT